MPPQKNDLLKNLNELIAQNESKAVLDFIEESLKTPQPNTQAIMEALYNFKIVFVAIVLEALEDYPANLLEITNWIRNNLDPQLTEIFGKAHSRLPAHHKKSIELKFGHDQAFLEWLRCFDRDLYVCPPTLYPILQQVTEKLSLHLAHDIIKLIETDEPTPYPLALPSDENPVPLYPIDEVLGVYIPEQQTVKLYKKEIKQVASRLGVKAETLRNVVLLHEVVHAIVHLGRDADGHNFETQAYLLVDNGLKPSPFHELIAQLICYHCVKDDQGLYECFLRLDHHQPEAYRHWIDLKDMSLEQIRSALIKLRRGEATATVSIFRQLW